MAKKSKNGNTQPAVRQAESVITTPPDKWPTMPDASDASTCVALVIPLRPLGSGYTQVHVDVNLSPAEGQVLRRIGEELQAGHAQLGDGRHVDSANDTIRWLLQMVAYGEHVMET